MILSIDQSFRECSYTIANVTSGKIEIEKVVTFTIKQKTHKHYWLSETFRELIKEHDITHVYYEHQFQAAMHVITGAVLAAIPPTAKSKRINVKSARSKLFKGFSYDKQTIYDASLVRWPQLKGLSTGAVDSFVQLVSEHVNSKIIFKAGSITKPVKKKKKTT